MPFWVIASSATAIALGTYTGGWRIIRTMGSRIIKMDPAQGFAAQGAGAAVVLTASHLGFPLSTTHVISGGVMGAGAAKRLSAVRWGLAGNIAFAWVLTLPAAALIGGLVYGVSSVFGSGALGPLVVAVGLVARCSSSIFARRLVPAARRGGAGMIAAIDVGKLFELVWAAALASVAVGDLLLARDHRRGARRGLPAQPPVGLGDRLRGAVGRRRRSRSSASRSSASASSPRSSRRVAQPAARARATMRAKLSSRSTGIPKPPPASSATKPCSALRTARAAWIASSPSRP